MSLATPFGATLVKGPRCYICCKLDISSNIEYSNLKIGTRNSSAEFTQSRDFTAVPPLSAPPEFASRQPLVFSLSRVWRHEGLVHASRKNSGGLCIIGESHLSAGVVFALEDPIRNG